MGDFNETDPGAVQRRTNPRCRKNRKFLGDSGGCGKAEGCEDKEREVHQICIISFIGAVVLKITVIMFHLICRSSDVFQ